MASIEEVSNEYFKSMNSLAGKISNDLASTREAYQDLWYKLSDEEKKQVLDEAVIDPAAVLKYTRSTVNNIDWNENTRDFMWFTKSQLNLFTSSSLRGDKQKTPVKNAEIFSPVSLRSGEMQESKSKGQSDTNLLNKLKNKVPILKTISSTEEKQNLVDNKNQMTLTPKLAISKPKTPPPPPPTKAANMQMEKRALLSNDNESDFSEDIPKTGFDFLDNW